MRRPVKTLVKTLGKTLVVGSALFVAGCGAGLGDGDDCEISVIVETAVPVAGASVVVRASSATAGFLEVDWSLSFESMPVACTDDTSGLCDGTTIAFLPVEPGTYQVGISGSVDGVSCSGDQRTINVMAPGANNAVYRMVVTPFEPAAIYQETLAIPGGANFDLGELRLGQPIAAAGEILESGAPIAAQLRVATASTSTGAAIDAFASETLGYELLISPSPINLEVLPLDPSLAPVRLSSLEPISLGDIEIPPADQLTGIARGPSGAPLESARVLVRDQGLPSSLATTDSAGSFALAARPSGSPAAIVVSPAEGSGLPILEGLVGAMSDGSALAVDYDAGLSTAQASFTVTEADGATPIAGALVTFVSEPISAAGFARVNGGSGVALEGRVRRSAIADGAGLIANLTLTAATYSVVIARPSDAPGPPTVLRQLAVSGGGVNLAAAQPAQWRATILDPSGSPVPSARLSFRPVGELATAAFAAASAVTDAGGVVSTSLVAGGNYELQIDGGGDVGRVLLGALAAAAPGSVTDVGNLALPASQRVTGQVTLASGAAARAHVAFYCKACPTPDVPTAIAVTDSSGAFAIFLPDSGTQ